MTDPIFDPDADLRRARYRDFAHTVRVIAARSLSQPATEVGAVSRGVVSRFKIERRAAAPGDTMDLPEGEILARGGQLGLTYSVIADGIEVIVQLKGFAAVRAGASKSGRLTTTTGSVDASFTFDARGRARCVLHDAPSVRSDLDSVDVEIFEA
jgi:hypothetical protein